MTSRSHIFNGRKQWKARSMKKKHANESWRSYLYPGKTLTSQYHPFSWQSFLCWWSHWWAPVSGRSGVPPATSWFSPVCCTPPPGASGQTPSSNLPPSSPGFLEGAAAGRCSQRSPSRSTSQWDTQSLLQEDRGHHIICFPNGTLFNT